MKSKLFQIMDGYPNVQSLNKPSLLDDDLNGTYCSSYNNLVQSKGVYFWGTEGGRNIRSDLELAIKREFKLGLHNLTSDCEYLLLNSTYRDVWKLSKEDQEAWVEKVRSARKQSQNNAVLNDIISVENRKPRRRNKSK